MSIIRMELTAGVCRKDWESTLKGEVFPYSARQFIRDVILLK